MGEDNILGFYPHWPRNRSLDLLLGLEVSDKQRSKRITPHAYTAALTLSSIAWF
jgi:hypothetical protein